MGPAKESKMFSELENQDIKVVLKPREECISRRSIVLKRKVKREKDKRVTLGFAKVKIVTLTRRIAED